LLVFDLFTHRSKKGKALVLSAVLSLFALAPAFAMDISEADDLLIKNQYKQAEEAYRELIDTDETGDAYAGLAVALAKQPIASKVIEAEKVLKQGKTKFPDNSNIVAAGGYVAYVHSRSVASPAKRDQYLDASEMLCKRAIKDNPDILLAQQTLGLVKMAQDDYEGAVDPFRKSIAIAENAVNLTMLAQVLLKLNPKDHEGEELIDKALSLKSDYALARLQKAIVLLNQDKAEEAFIELKSIPEVARTPDWHLVVGDVYKKQGDGPAALTSWKESVRQDPHNPDAYRHLAEYHTLRGDGEMAISEMHDALEILPNDMLLRNQLAELALRLDKLDVAEQEYKTILTVQEDDPTALLGLSRVYFKKARKDGQYPPDWAKLEERLQNVVTEKSVRGQVVDGAKNLQENIQLNEAEKSLTQQKFREAHKLFSGIIDTHREEPYALLTLGEQCFNDGDLKSAEQAYNYAKEIPEVASRAEQGISKINYQRHEADRFVKLGDATQSLPTVAIDHYHQALIADPQYPPAFYGLFTVFRETHDSDRAIDNAICFLEVADDGNPRRREVEASIAKLRRHSSDKVKTK
jgi:tetratricopeptide (TPR) repeat protein